jgi:hypothetical protein
MLTLNQEVAGSSPAWPTILPILQSTTLPLHNPRKSRPIQARAPIHPRPRRTPAKRFPTILMTYLRNQASTRQVRNPAPATAATIIPTPWSNCLLTSPMKHALDSISDGNPVKTA